MTIALPRNRQVNATVNGYLTGRHPQDAHALTDPLGIPRGVIVLAPGGSLAIGSRDARQPTSIRSSIPQAHFDGLPARAKSNIELWTSYLPSDCVQAMIRDGWHLSV